MLGEDVLFLTATDLGERIRTRKITSTELTESYLERSERIGPTLNAYACITRELALRQAKAADAEIAAGKYRGPLHGIPYAPKDLVAAKGYPTTWGAKPYNDQTFDFDATLVERLNKAGAILIGKAAMIELAGGLGYTTGKASLTGPCRNPWKTDYWTCGSSSGSGAIAAAGLAVFTIGSDTRGSIICPSSWCGVSGMRPSFGRVSKYGSMAIAWTMDKLGPMARSADDCGLILAAIAGHDPKDHDSLPGTNFQYTPGQRNLPQPLRVGHVTNAYSKLAPGLEQAVAEALKVLEKNGAQIKDVQVPDGPYEEVAELTILMEAAASFETLIHSGRCAELQDPHGQINGYASEEFSAADYLHVQRVRTFLQKKIERLFDDCDVLVAAGESSGAQPIESPPEEDAGEAMEEHEPDGISSLFGLPAVAVPCGFSKDKLPFAVQFVGAPMDDATVLAAASLFQSKTEWHRQHPRL